MGISFSFIDVDTDPKPLDKINSLFSIFETVTLFTTFFLIFSIQLEL